MFLKLWHCQTIWYLLAGFTITILCSVHSMWFVKYVFFAKIWFMKTSTRIVKTKSRVIKSNPASLLKACWKNQSKSSGTFSPSSDMWRMLFLGNTRTKTIVINTNSGNTICCCSCQNFSVSLVTPKNLIRWDYCISFYGTMTILPDNVIVMKRHYGKIDGGT